MQPLVHTIAVSDQPIINPANNKKLDATPVSYQITSSFFPLCPSPEKLEARVIFFQALFLISGMKIIIELLSDSLWVANWVLNPNKYCCYFHWPSTIIKHVFYMGCIFYDKKKWHFTIRRCPTPFPQIIIIITYLNPLYIQNEIRGV